MELVWGLCFFYTFSFKVFASLLFMLFFLLFGPGRAQQLANTFYARQLVAVDVWARLSIGSQTPAPLGRAESIQVCKQAMLQQLGQAYPRLVRLDWSGRVGPWSQTRPKALPSAYKPSRRYLDCFVLIENNHHLRCMMQPIIVHSEEVHLLCTSHFFYLLCEIK
jgi:hypothetical protein